MTIYLARDLTTGEAQPEADESIECQLIPLFEALEHGLSEQDSRRQTSPECCGWRKRDVAGRFERHFRHASVVINDVENAE